MQKKYIKFWEMLNRLINNAIRIWIYMYTLKILATTTALIDVIKTITYRMFSIYIIILSFLIGIDCCRETPNMN